MWFDEECQRVVDERNEAYRPTFIGEYEQEQRNTLKIDVCRQDVQKKKENMKT